MPYPLAHDENGIPLDVPATATGWLVRRHGGGKGRPGAVYDDDGRPLVLALDATAADLRGHGCKSGRYRLEAVDADRRPLRTTAFTELSAGRSEAADDGTGPGRGPDAVAALARAVEAMQRVQAERERAQAEMFMRLIDRLSPVQSAPAVGLRETIGQVVELQRAIREAADDVGDAGERDANWWNAPPIAKLANTVAAVAPSLLSQFVFKKLGLTDEQIAEMAEATAAVTGAPTPATSEVRDAEDAHPDAPAFTEAEVGRRLDAVFAELADDAHAARVLMRQIPPGPMLDAAITHLMRVDVATAAEYIRRQLRTARPAGAAAKGGA